MYDPGDVLRQTSPDVLSVKEWPVYIYQEWISAIIHHDISLHTNQQLQKDFLQIAEPLESPAANRSAAIRSRMQLELKVQVGCHSFHFDL